MPIPTDLRLALLELTNLLDTLVRRPLPHDALVARDIARFNATVLLTLSRAREVLDAPDEPAFSYDIDPPEGMLPPTDILHRLQARADARSQAEPSFAPRRPRP